MGITARFLAETMKTRRLNNDILKIQQGSGHLELYDHQKDFILIEREIETFRNRKPKVICHQQTCPTRNVKGSLLDRNYDQIEMCTHQRNQEHQER